VRDVAGNDVFTANYEHFQADLVITLADPFGLLKAAQAGVLRQVNLAHWFPVDVVPLGAGDVTVLREGQGVPIAMSQFGRRVLAAEGAEPLYVPHGVDTDLFCPGDPSAYRDTVPAIGPDTFSVGIVAMNRGRRKAFDQQMLAFSRFHARHPDSFLALHTAPEAPAPATNLHGLATALGITGAVGFPDSYMYDTGQITQEHDGSLVPGLDVCPPFVRGRFRRAP
jgi:hypothetical protein